MATYRNVRRRSFERPSQHIKRRFIFTIIILALLLYATVVWILPFFVGSVGFFTNIFKPSKNITQVADNASLAPPVLNIPYEATNTAQIDIPGYATPNSEIGIYVDDNLKDTEKVGDDGTFLVQSIELSMGTNRIYGKTIDEDEQESLPSKTITVLFDDEKPPLEVSEPNDGKEQQGERNLKIAGKSEAGVRVLVNDSQIIVKSDGSFETMVSLSDGDNNYTIKAIDKAENSTEVSRKVVFKP